MGAHAHGALTSKGSFARAKQAVKKSRGSRACRRVRREMHRNFTAWLACRGYEYMYVYTFARDIDVVAREHAFHRVGP